MRESKQTMNPRWFWNGVGALGAVLRRRSTRAWFAQSALALVSVLGATFVIGYAQSATRISNISLLYLLVVLWLAARYGRWPAILASVFAFLCYDFFLIPPLHTFTVDKPTEWISLVALLATALTLGHLTAAVRARARDAEESQRQTDTLYRQATLIAASASEHDLYATLARQMVTVFAPSGARSCALTLPDGTIASESAAHPDDTGVGAARDTERITLLRPLRTQRGEVGALRLTGTPALGGLWPEGITGGADIATGAETDARQAALFTAMCDQIALAIERSALAREAAHAETLRESDRLKDALLGSVTHDLRTPLASIKAAASSLLREDIAWDTPERQELLVTIDTSADRLNRLVGNLLDLSRLEAGVAQPAFDWTLMSDVIATVLDRLDVAGLTRGFDIRVEEPDNAPLAWMDHEQIEQVLTNLLENALKYSPQGSVIRVRVGVNESELSVAVIDQGIGIPPGELDAIFDRFYRVKQERLPWVSARPPVGTGLGLAICASIIRAHGGRIWAESAPGAGATLTFTLPLAGERPVGALPDLPEPPHLPAVAGTREGEG